MGTVAYMSPEQLRGRGRRRRRAMSGRSASCSTRCSPGTRRFRARYAEAHRRTRFATTRRRRCARCGPRFPRRSSSSSFARCTRTRRSASRAGASWPARSGRCRGTRCRSISRRRRSTVPRAQAAMARRGVRGAGGRSRWRRWCSPRPAGWRAWYVSRPPGPHVRRHRAGRRTEPATGRSTPIGSALTLELTRELGESRDVRVCPIHGCCSCCAGRCWQARRGQSRRRAGRGRRERGTRHRRAHAALRQRRLEGASRAAGCRRQRHRSHRDGTDRVVDHEG